MRTIDGDVLIEKAYDEAKGMAEPYDDFGVLVEWLVDKSPPIEPEPHWIPCSERLPERKGWYLCTLKDGRVDCYYWSGKGEWVDNGKKHFFDLYNIRSRYTGEEIKPEQEGSVYWTDWVIAWMPLPEPYKGGK
jgi:hypothetical protein